MIYVLINVRLLNYKIFYQKMKGKKRLLYLFVFTLSFAVFISCCKNEDNVFPLNDGISLMVNAWNTASGEENDPILSIRVENATDSVIFIQNYISNKDFGDVLEALVGDYIKERLFKVTFKSDGELVAFIKGENGNPVQSPAGAVSYKIKGDKVYLIPYLDVMFPDGLPSLLSIAIKNSDIDMDKFLSEGFPFNYKVTNDKLELYVTRDMLQPFIGLINEIVQSMDTNGDFMITMMKMAMGDMVVIVNESTKIEIGLNFNLATSATQE